VFLDTMNMHVLRFADQSSRVGSFPICDATHPLKKRIPRSGNYRIFLDFIRRQDISDGHLYPRYLIIVIIIIALLLFLISPKFLSHANPASVTLAQTHLAVIFSSSREDEQLTRSVSAAVNNLAIPKLQQNRHRRRGGRNGANDLRRVPLRTTSFATFFATAIYGGTPRAVCCALHPPFN